MSTELPYLTKNFASSLERDWQAEILEDVNEEEKFAEESSPFRVLPDEQVFIKREVEKQKRREAKEKLKQLKVWDKKTASSRVPLKRVQNSDIIPAKFDEQVDFYNPRQRGLINKAMDIVKARVPKSKELQKQTLNDFVDQKKEMFLVQMALNIIKKETGNLKDKAEKKHIALEQSDLQMQADANKLNELMKKDQQETSEKQRKQEEILTEKKKQQEVYREILTKVNQIKGENSKNQDLITENYENYKNFLRQLSNQEWIQKTEIEKKAKVNEVRTKWVDNRMSQTDNLEFKGDDVSMSSSGRFAAGSKKSLHEKTKREALEKEFQSLLEADEIPGINYYDEELYFKTSKSLMDLFTDLEEKNLFLIQMNHEAEQTHESLKKHYLEVKIDKEKKILDLHNSRAQLRNQIGDVKANISAMNQFTSDASGDSELLKELKDKIDNAWGKTKPGHEKEASAKTHLQLLLQIENTLEDKLIRLTELQNVSRAEIQEIQSKIKSRRNDDKVKEINRKNLDDIEKKRQATNARREKKIPKITGKPTMGRSAPPKKKSPPKERTVVDEMASRKKYFIEDSDE